MSLLKGTLLASKSDSYGHNSGYGASGYGGSGGHGSYSGLGSDCCDPVIDPKTVLGLMTFIGAATYFLQQQIEMSMLMMARKRRRVILPEYHFILQGMNTELLLCEITIMGDDLARHICQRIRD